MSEPASGSDTPPPDGSQLTTDAEQKKEAKCVWCKKSITNESEALKQANAVFCSDHCFRESCHAARSSKACDWCKRVPFSVMEIQVGTTNLQFCSEICINQYKMHNSHQVVPDDNTHQVNAPSSSNLITPDMRLNNQAASPNFTPSNLESVVNPKQNKEKFNRKKPGLPRLKIGLPPIQVKQYPNTKIDERTNGNSSSPASFIMNSSIHSSTNYIRNLQSSQISNPPIGMRHPPPAHMSNIPNPYLSDDGMPKYPPHFVPRSKNPFPPDHHRQPPSVPTLPPLVAPMSNLMKQTIKSGAKKDDRTEGNSSSFASTILNSSIHYPTNYTRNLQPFQTWNPPIGMSYPPPAHINLPHPHLSDNGMPKYPPHFIPRPKNAFPPDHHRLPSSMPALPPTVGHARPKTVIPYPIPLPIPFPKPISLPISSFAQAYIQKHVANDEEAPLDYSMKSINNRGENINIPLSELNGE